MDKTDFVRIKHIGSSRDTTGEKTKQKTATAWEIHNIIYLIKDLCPEYTK